MIKIIIVTTLTLLVVIVGVNLFGEDSGYVYIKINQTNIELSLLLLLIIWLTSTVAFYYLFKIIGKIINLKKDLSAWKYKRNLESAFVKLSNGFIELGNGNYAKAEKLLSNAARKTKYSLVPLIGAANAAQQRGDEQTRNYLLKKALQENKKAKVSLNLTKSDYLLSLGKYQEAQAILDNLEKLIKNNPLALKIQANIYARTSQWDKLLPLIPQLPKKTNLSLEEITQLEYQAHRFGLISTNDASNLKSLWKKVPKSLKSNKGIVVEYVHQLRSANDYKTAAKILLDNINKKWDEDLAIIYSELPLPELINQINKLEQWIASYPKNAKLQLSLAKLYIRQELWVMAKDSVKQSIEINNTLEAQAILNEVEQRIRKFEQIE